MLNAARAGLRSRAEPIETFSIDLLPCRPMDAESAYLFRHGLLREAAYQLQIPSDRAQLHALAVRVIESVFDGPPPPLASDARGEVPVEPHALDSLAEELALHAKMGQSPGNPENERLRASEVLYLMRAANWANDRYHFSRALQWFEAVAAHPNTFAELKARALREAGWLHYVLGRPDKARALLDESVTLARKRGIHGQEGKALGALAFVLSELGHPVEARSTAVEALKVQRAAGARGDEARTLTFLANIATKTGGKAEAEKLYLEALDIFRALGDLRGEGFALANLAPTVDRPGREAEADAIYRQALELLRKAGNQRIEAIVLGNMAAKREVAGHLEEAERLYDQALAIHREVGNLRSEGFALGNVAALYEKTGRMEQAEAAFLQALEIHAKVKAKWSLGVHRCDFALFKLRRGLRLEAGVLWRLGAATLQELGDTVELSDKQRLMHEACNKAGVPPFDREN